MAGPRQALAAALIALVAGGGGFLLARHLQPAEPVIPEGVPRVPKANAGLEGQPAPDLAIQDLDGKPRKLSEWRGRWLLVNFWATWCGPCRIEMPAMERLYRSYSRKDFEILAVSTDPQGAAVTRPFQQEMGFTFPILHDAEYRIGLMYGARSLPMTFMVDRQGIVRQKVPGARDWGGPDARELIQALMKS